MKNTNWISTTEKLPKDTENYLVYGDGQYTVTFYSHRRKQWNTDFKVESYQELPDGPKVEKKKNTKKEVTVTLKVTMKTNKDSNTIMSALTRGIYRGLDTSPDYIARPTDVDVKQINYNAEDTIEDLGPWNETERKNAENKV